MDDYVSKPIRIDDMTKAIKRYTDKITADMSKTTERKPDERPIVNMQALFANLNSDEEIIEKFMFKIPEHIQAALESLEEAIASKNTQDMEYAAHSLRGLCMHFDMYKVTDLTSEIEMDAISKTLTDIPQLFSVLKVELAEALIYIKERKGLALSMA